MTLEKMAFEQIDIVRLRSMKSFDSLSCYKTYLVDRGWLHILGGTSTSCNQPNAWSAL